MHANVHPIPGRACCACVRGEGLRVLCNCYLQHGKRGCVGGCVHQHPLRVPLAAPVPLRIDKLPRLSFLVLSSQVPALLLPCLGSYLLPSLVPSLRPILPLPPPAPPTRPRPRHAGPAAAAPADMDDHAVASALLRFARRFFQDGQLTPADIEHRPLQLPASEVRGTPSTPPHPAVPLHHCTIRMSSDGGRKREGEEGRGGAAGGARARQHHMPSPVPRHAHVARAPRPP